MQSIQDGQVLRIRHPDRLPVHVITDIEMTKTKFLIPSNMTVAEFLYNIRQAAGIKLTASQGTYVMMGKEKRVMVAATQTFALLDQEFCSDDHILRLHLYKENMFGK